MSKAFSRDSAKNHIIRLKKTSLHFTQAETEPLFNNEEGKLRAFVQGETNNTLNSLNDSDLSKKEKYTLIKWITRSSLFKPTICENCAEQLARVER